jgi:hypothetical protein
MDNVRSEASNMIPTHRHREWRRVAPLALLLVAGWQLGCSQQITPPPLPPTSALDLEQPLPAAGESALRIASIGQSGEPVQVEVPSTAKVGQSVPVAVTTYSGGCISDDTTAVDVHPHLANVVPYQRVYQPRQNEGCTMELRVNRREVGIVFREPGPATVTVYGRTYPGGLLTPVTRQLTVE